MFVFVCLATIAMAFGEDPPAADPAAQVPAFTAKGGNNAMDWTFADAANWGLKYKNCAKEGVQQSPIDVPADVQTKAFDDRRTRFYDGKYTMVISNNGRNLKMTYICCNTPFIYGGALPLNSNKEHDKYFFYYANIFVGKDNTSGSQHTFAGKSYPLEVTLHSFKLTDDLTAEQDKNSAAVSLFFEETAEDNMALKPFIEAVDRAHKFDDVTQFKTDNLLAMFIPKPVHGTYPNDYFTYQGTLTTPPCDDKVTYFLLRTPLQIGKAQLEILRKLEDEKEKKIAGNRRPIQKLLDPKTVFKSDPVNFIKW